MNLGNSVTATVERVEAFGVFLSHQGETILVLVTELAWQPIADPSQQFKPGDSVQVRVLNYIPEEGLYVGSIRAASLGESPYVALAAAPRGRRFTGHVQGIFGGIVSVVLTDPQALGVLPLDRAPPGLRPGDSIEVIVKSVDIHSSRIEFDIPSPQS